VAHALLVEPDTDTRGLFAQVLRRSACDVEEAEDGREALAKALSSQPDVIVTEARLPGMSGYDLCRLLRRDGATRAIPIVVITGDVYPADVNRALAAGADAVLVKPCLPEQLLAEVRHVVQQADALRARVVSKTSHRRDTTDPPLAPPTLVCPICDRALRYLQSHIGGVSVRHQEQWDDFECPVCCGKFQYRHRTRRLKRVA
jgi:two-component system, cell cycle response regulator DivK